MKKLILICALATASLSGCAEMTGTGGVGSGDYTAQQARQAQQVQTGLVEAVRLVTINTSNNATNASGAGVGALLGGLLGNQVGNGTGKIIASMVGGLGGGIVGSAAQQKLTNIKGIEIAVKMDNGQTIAVSQAVDDEIFHVGDRVKVVSSGWGGVSRVTH